MAKIHISSKGVPTKCPAKIRCRLSPAIGHFDKKEQAEAFADELNELVAQNRTHLGINSKTVSEMSDVELIYISNKIKDEADSNENYKDYKGTVKWQKEVRSKASKEMQSLLEENNKMSEKLGKQIDKVDDLRSKWKNEEDPTKRKDLYNQLKTERKTMNELRDSFGPKMNENLNKFSELKVKKETAEEKVLNGMRKQAIHSETKAILSDVETEIEKRGYKKEQKDVSNSIKINGVPVAEISETPASEHTIIDGVSYGYTSATLENGKTAYIPFSENKTGKKTFYPNNRTKSDKVIWNFIEEDKKK